MTVGQLRAMVLTVAPMQLPIAVLLAMDHGVKPALIAGATFLVATTPLGPENAISLLFAAGAIILLRRESKSRTELSGTREEHRASLTRASV